MTASIDQFRTLHRRTVSSLFSVAFVTAILGSASVGRNLDLAIYGLSFWHYYLYWLAFYFGAVPPDVFKRDAVLMKSVALLALGAVYLAAPLNLASLVVVACGFLLNGIAARALGADRTYYGHELSELPLRRITAFPYSWISHPMLVGNILAFSGLMIDADFSRRWWPLACAHVALNLGLLVMELAVTPQRRSARCAVATRAGSQGGWREAQTGCGIAVAGAALALGFGPNGTSGADIQAATTGNLCLAGAGACASLYAYVLYRSYSVPRILPVNRRDHQSKDTL